MGTFRELNPKYVIKHESGEWRVWDTDELQTLSAHESEREAKAAVNRYKAGDKRRARP